MTTPNLGFTELVLKQLNPENTVNDNLRLLDIIIQTTVLNATLTTPPGSPTNGDRYIPAATATGAWVGFENYIAYYYNGWFFVQPAIGWIVYDVNISKYKTWNGTSWILSPMEPEVLDTEFRVVKSTDSTSKMDFDMSKVATATTTTFIMPNGDVEFAKTKLDATTAPTVNDDITFNYEPGSVWVDITGNKGYLCVDNTDGAAIWREMAGATGTGDVVGPASSVDNTIARADGTGGKTIQYSSIIIDDSNALYNHNAKLSADKTANYTVATADGGTIIVCNTASAITITLPDSISTIGFQGVIINRGSGLVTVAIQTDTLESKNGNTDIGQYSAASFLKVASTVWALHGDLQ